MGNLIDPEKLGKENLAIQKYLNDVIGLVSFTLGLTCLTFDNSLKIACLCLPVITILFVIGIRNLPGEARALNELVNETQDKEAIEEKKHYFGNKALLKQIVKCPMYIYGFSFYLAILIIPGFSEWLKT